MSELNLKFELSSFKLAVIFTLILVILNILDVIHTSIWVTLLPIFIVVGWWFFVIFLIGLLTLLTIARELANTEDSDNQEETP